MDLKLKGKTALVTASTGGIGMEIALHLAIEGVKVIVNGRTSKTVSRACDKISSNYPDAELLPLVADNGSSITSSLLLLVDSCSKGFQLRLPVTPFSPRFTIEVTNILCGGDAVTTALVGRDLHPHGYQVFKVRSNRPDGLVLCILYTSALSLHF